MGPHVQGEIAFLLKPPLTRRTLECPVACVNSLMKFELGPLDKRLAADFALVGLLPGVLPGVDGQVVDVGALVVALWAGICLRFGVCSLVRFEIGFRQTFLAARIAFEGTLA